MNNRLQFRHHNEVFATRQAAIEYIKRGIENATEGLAKDDKSLGFSLYAEPTVLRYVNEEDETNPHIILAIASDTNTGTQYNDNRFCIIDIDKTEDEIEDIEEQIINIAKSLTIITRNTSTLSLYSEKTDDGTILSGNVNVAETHIFNDVVKKNNILKGPDGLFIYVDLKYDDEHESFTFSVSNANDTLTETTVKLPNNYLVEGSYDSEDDSLHLRLRDGQEVVVSLEYIINLIDTVSADTLTRLQDILNYDHSINVDRSEETRPVIAVNLSDEVEDSGHNIIKLNNDGLFAGVDLEYVFNPENGSNQLIFKTTNGTKTYDLKTNSVVDKIYYDPTIESIVIEYTVNGHRMPDVVIPVGDLIDEWRVEDGHPNAVQLEKIRESGATKDVLKAAVVISDAHDDNMLIMDNGALYVSSAGIASNKAEITSLKNRMNEAESGINTLNNNLDREVTRAISAETALENALNSEIIRSQNTDDELSSSLRTTQAALASETNRAQEAENTLRSDINQETTRAIGIENNLQTAINNEAYRASSAETNLDNKIEREISRANAAEGVLQTSLDMEISRATDKESELQTALNSEISRATSKDNELTTSLQDEIVRALSAETDINTAIRTERDRAINAESAITISLDSTRTALSNEITRATTAENNLQDTLTHEIARATSAETAIRDAVTQEATRAYNEEQILNTKLGNEVTRASNEEARIETKLNNEISRSTTVDESLEGSITSLESAIDDEKTRAESAEHTLQANIGIEQSRAENVENSLLTTINTEKSRAMLIEQDLQAAIGTEKNRAINAESAITTSLNNEVTRSTSVDEQHATAIENNTTAIAAEKYRAETAESALTADITAEVSRATIAEQGLSNAISAEESRAKAAESALTVALNTEATTRAHMDEDLQEDIDEEIARAREVEATLQSSILTEVARAQHAEEVLNNNLIAEISRATSSETIFTNALNDEINRATSAETAIASDLATETTRAINAESALTTSIGNETSRATAEESRLEGLINTEVTNRTNAISTISSRVDDITYTFGESNTTKMSVNNKVVTTNIKMPVSDDNIIVPSDGIKAVVNLTYNAATNVLTFAKSTFNGVTTSMTTNDIALNIGSVIDNISYDEENKKIIISYHSTTGEHKTTEVDVSDLFNDWDVSPNHNGAVQLTKTLGGDSPDILSASIVISQSENNILRNVNGSLFVDGSNINTISATSECTKSELKKVETAVFGSSVIVPDCGGNFKYTPSEATKYIVSATSINEALTMLDSSVFTVSGNVNTVNNRVTTVDTNATCTKNALEKFEKAVIGHVIANCGDGYTYEQNQGANYISTALSFNSADVILDTEIKKTNDALAVANQKIEEISGGGGSYRLEIDNIENGAGLDNLGYYVADATAHYVSGATSLFNADKILDNEVYALNQYLKISSLVDTTTVDITNTNGAVKADVKISADASNALGLKSDGLFINNDFNCGTYTEGSTTEDDYSNEARK